DSWSLVDLYRVSVNCFFLGSCSVSLVRGCGCFGPTTLLVVPIVV
ncbi:hypothetical protein A2U01_0014197, partial [Trifolium medium]|nr:hypothetical protein [Trifolium medium]